MAQRAGRRRASPRACATIRPRGHPMAILKVARLGHPVLRQLAAPVPIEQISSAETQRLIDDMVETMREYNGAGLAAPQVHDLRQICVIEVHGNPRYPDAPAIPLTVLINPVVTPLTEEMEDGWEGSRIDVVAKEFFARVTQHETDHLHGRVYLDRMRDFTTLTHLAEWNRYWLGNQEQDD